MLIIAVVYATCWVALSWSLKDASSRYDEEWDEYEVVQQLAERTEKFVPQCEVFQNKNVKAPPRLARSAAADDGSSWWIGALISRSWQLSHDYDQLQAANRDAAFFLDAIVPQMQQHGCTATVS